MKFIACLLIGFFFLLSFSSAAQVLGSGKVHGSVVDSFHARPLVGATVSVLSRPESLVVSVGLSGQDGNFFLQNLAFGSYILQVSYTGFETLQKTFTLSQNHPVFHANTLNLFALSNVMDDIVVTTSPITINGDTTDIRVGQFKTIPNATAEDLLKKLPGVEVDKSGNIQSQGEKVTRILVDGKRFFGKDPKMATRNLPADVIDRIQIIDSKSEQSEFSGFDDGERVQTLNIVTKKDKKQGWFGKGTVSAGTDERTANGISGNYFKGNRQITFVAQNNNINSQQFTTQDFLGAANEGADTRRRSTNNATDRQPGVSSTNAAGMNYNDLWGTQTQLNASYFYDNINNVYNRNRYRETFFAGDSSLFQTSDTKADNRNKSHRLNLELDHQFDSSNSLLLRPELNLQSANNFSETNTFTTRGKTVDLNRVNNFIQTQTRGYEFNNSILYRHRFNNTGRSISINLTQRLNANDWNRDNVAYTLRPNGRRDTLDQVSSNLRDGQSFGANLSLTEQIGARSQLELTYAYNNTANTADQQTFRLNKATNVYDVEVGNLTNQFENTNISHRAGLNYRLQLAPELMLSTGLAVQRATLGSDNISKQAHINQSFTNLFPNFNLIFRKTRRTTMRLSYRGTTRQPGIVQLQDVLDNSRILHIRSGNPALKQEFVNALVFRYNTFNATTRRQLSINVNGSVTANNIANTHTINNLSDTILVDGFKLGPGVQFSKYRNVDGAFDFGASANYSFPVTQTNGNYLHLGTRLRFDREVNLINQQASNTDNYFLSASARLTININERFDLNLSTNTQYNIARYSVFDGGGGNFFQQRFSAEPTYTTANGWILANDFDYLFNRGQTEGFNQSVPLWNMSLSKLFLKDRQAELKLSVFDLLNKNIDVSRNVEQNYVEDIRSQVLKRYFLVGFIYHLNKFPGAAKAEKRKQAKANRQ